ncbi:hypothetical protein [Bacillus toyonensis]|uniref:Uncharacterized protein n=1 Tax=Bacillus toyonensis TaxID=155322 RepID=A0AB73QSQ9_9BACI|nr:hypothetical protein [Bacillus toyonensis]PEI82859.1 hypothetical protein CN678_26630 [Bacillus toyonensis]PEK35417.1 hypothetical protein CN586_31215 [Bacillus toyonensis]PEL42537.1 hypothetical protein CN638_30520 [Bacillus toyonensis]PEM44003.1 hypothetical protein CN636_14110 [Bacillus toyonensis]PGB69193.1 hypothetical protein COM00_00940 [Bacillus toyonensis]
MLLFHEDITLGVIKEIGEGELVLLVKEEELTIKDTAERWNEEDMEELQRASERVGEDRG